jgi:hypothetical protein
MVGAILVVALVVAVVASRLFMSLEDCWIGIIMGDQSLCRASDSRPK